MQHTAQPRVGMEIKRGQFRSDIDARQIFDIGGELVVEETDEPKMGPARLLLDFELVGDE